MITVRILSPESSREFKASAVFLPGVLGEFETLENHAPIISLLEEGDVKWRVVSGEMESEKVKGGVVRLENNIMEICID